MPSWRTRAGQPHRIAASDAGHAPRAGCRAPEYAEAFDRNFMRVGSADRPARSAGNVRRPMYLETWSDHYQDAAAQLIAAAYAGHIDSRINDQYRSVAGARGASSSTSCSIPVAALFSARPRMRLLKPQRPAFAASRWPAWYRRTAAISRRSAFRRRFAGPASATPCCASR